MSIRSRVKTIAAALAAATLGLSSAAWATSAAHQHQMEETDGHDHATHKKEHNLDGKGKTASTSAKAAAPKSAKSDKRDSDVLHQTEETDGHDHAQHKKDHNLTR